MNVHCPFFHVPEHRSYIAQKAYICRNVRDNYCDQEHDKWDAGCVLVFLCGESRYSMPIPRSENYVIQASLVIRDLTLRVFAITRFRGKKP
jgi:hypothetical protein